MTVRCGLLLCAAVLALLPGSAQAQGSATFLSAGDVDYLDPGQTYYTFGYQVQFAVNRPLYGFRPGDGGTPVPDLAEGPPEISADNRQITVRIRPGVRYAPPVGREVTAADVKYAIERAFSHEVLSGYATSYFSELEGARFARGVRNIPGVQTPDRRTLVLRLTKPVAQRVAAALVMPITVPVPREFAEPHDRRSPSTYDEHVAFTGPYMVARRDPGREIRLVRNPNWDRATDLLRPAHLDEIVIDQGNDDLGAAARRALTGSRLMCCDAGAPPVPVLKAAMRDRPAQVQRASGGGTRWIALNTRIRPFNRAAVRRGVAAGLNRERLRATRGGATVGPIAQHFIPPGLPGHAETNVAGLDFLRNPKGDRGLARRYFKQARLRRTRRPLLMIGTNADPGRRTAKELARQMRRLGFRIRLRLVPQDTLYTKWCGVPRARVPICANVGWFKDFHDPESLLRPTFHSREIRRQGNVNWSQLRVPSIDRAMDAAMTLPVGPDRSAAWARVNQDVAAQAGAIPYVWDDSFQVASADLETPMNPYTTTIDLSFVKPR